MTDKKLEEAGRNFVFQVKGGRSPTMLYNAFIFHAGQLLKWKDENPKLCEWCDRPEVEEFWHDHNGQRICKECYDHHKG